MHEHKWVLLKVWGETRIWICDIRGVAMPARKFCGAIGYEVPR